MGPYRILISIFAAVAAIAALRSGGWRVVRARLGGGAGGPDAPHVWWHGASNGELTSARPILERMLVARPDLHVLVTANSDSGVALVQGWGLERVSVRPAPVDLAWVSRRVMRRWRVVAHVTLESELWPHRVLTCPGPVLLLGARLTPGTARAWGRLPRLARRVLGRVSYCSAQDAGSADRLAGLGLPADARGPVVDLKAYSVPAPLPPDPALSFDRDRTWLAASTHEGEEAIVLEAHRLALRTLPDLALILAPRHPRRAEAIATLIRQAGFTVARRSRGETPAPGAVYLADTLGEMARWYAAAGRVFIGGTLVDRGGHTPYEPAAFGAAILHGPDTRNFATSFARLDGIAARVADANELAEALARWHAPDACAEAGAAARAALRPQTDPGRLCDAVCARIPVQQS